MKQSIHDAFDTVSCDEVLKGRTCEYVIKHMHRSRKPAPRRMKWAVSLACLLLFATSGLGGYSLYYTEAAVISIDVNPSIELDINRWGKVVDQTTYGEESETVLQSLSLKHLEYEEALALLLASDAMQQYLKKDALVSITLETKDGDPQMFSSLQECVNTALMQCHGVKAEYASVDSHMCEEAHEHGMSLGKYYAIQELLTADPQATLDEFKDKSMKEIKVHTEHCEHRQQRIRGNYRGNPRQNHPRRNLRKNLRQNHPWQTSRMNPRQISRISSLTIPQNLPSVPTVRRTVRKPAVTAAGITAAGIRFSLYL